MVTSRMLGLFRSNASTRREFLALVGNPAPSGQCPLAHRHPGPLV